MTPAAGRVSAMLSLRGRRLVGATATARTAGAVTVRLPRLPARRAAALKGKAVTIKVTAGGRSATRKLVVR